MANLYEKYHSKSKWQSKVISDKNFTYINILPILNSCLSSKVKNILDIGCGSGAISLYIASKGYQVQGIDISKKAIRECDKSAKAIGLNNADFKVLKFPSKKLNQKFDLIFFSEVIEHLKNDGAALKECYSLLRDNGILILSTPSKNAPLYKLGLVKRFDLEVGHLRRYTTEEIISLLHQANFKVIRNYKKESILRNFLFINPVAGKSIRFIKYFLVDIFSYIDALFVKMMGESDIIIVAQKR